MTTSLNQTDCTRRCWIAGAVLGVLLLLVLLLSEWSFWGALVLGLVVFALIALLAPRVVCPVQAAPGQSFAPAADPVPAPAATTPPVAPAAPASEPVAETEPSAAEQPEPVAEPDPTPVAAVSAGVDTLVRPSAALADEAELAARKGVWRYQAKPIASSAKAKKPIVDTMAVGDQVKPDLLSAPRNGEADNLKQIKGVGPKLEQLLNALGVYHFDQIAGWSSAEIAWVDSNLQGFKGRVSRDGWVAQARILESGGETEFSARVDKGEVY